MPPFLFAKKARASTFSLVSDWDLQGGLCQAGEDVSIWNGVLSNSLHSQVPGRHGRQDTGPAGQGLHCDWHWVSRQLIKKKDEEEQSKDRRR